MAEKKKIKSIEIEALEDGSYLLNIQFVRPKETKNNPVNYEDYHNKGTAQNVETLKKKLTTLLGGLEDTANSEDDKLDAYLPSKGRMSSVNATPTSKRMM